jgi:thiol-disulfide isomerase/thioredoxin
LPPTVTPQRYAQGRTFDEYVAHAGSPQNLAREGSGGAPRRDFSSALRQAFERSTLNDAQLAAWQWLVAQPGGPAKMLVISEDWSSDCRRDVPTFARIAAATGMELRIFDRDGQRFSTANVPNQEDAPDSNADLMVQFLNHKGGQTYQSIPVCAFFDRDFQYLYHFVEYPILYDKDRLVVEHIRAPRPGESADQTRSRSEAEFNALQQSPFWRIWTSATVDEILSALQRRVVLGAV